MEIGVREAAKWLGVSERRVQALARSQRLPARRVSGAWMIDSALIGRSRARSRAMSPHIARALIHLLSEPEASASALGIVSREASRLRAKIRALLADRDPASLLASWLAAAGPAPLLLAAHPGDLPALLADPRLVPSGISDPRADLSVSDAVEGWVPRADLDRLIDDHMLAADGAPNVRLYGADRPVGHPVPLGRLLADLSAHPGPRESAAVHRLLHESALVAAPQAPAQGASCGSLTP
jgi:hypothetical protein